MPPLHRATRALPVLLVLLAVTSGCATVRPAGPATDETAAVPSDAPTPPAPSPTTAVSDQDVQTPQPTATAPDGRATAVPSVTSAVWNDAADAVEVSAFVPVIETTGTCLLTLTMGASTASAESVAYPDASSTSCDLLSVPGSQLAPGTWVASVTYSSPDSTGRSVATEVTVP